MKAAHGRAGPEPEEPKVKARMYERMLPVLALLAVVVEGLGAGVKWM